MERGVSAMKKIFINYDDSYNSISYDSVFWKDEQADIIRGL